MPVCNACTPRSEGAPARAIKAIDAALRFAHPDDPDALAQRITHHGWRNGFFVSAVSVLVWLGTDYGLHWGWIGCIGAQFGIFVALTIINMLRKNGR